MAFITQTLRWKPKAKDRPRFTVTPSGRRIAYTDPATRAAEQELAAQWVRPPVEGPIRVKVILSDTEVKVEIESVPPYTCRKLRADCDNYMKLVLDALNRVAWNDDNQIVEITGVKL